MSGPVVSAGAMSEISLMDRGLVCLQDIHKYVKGQSHVKNAKATPGGYPNANATPKNQDQNVSGAQNVKSLNLHNNRISKLELIELVSSFPKLETLQLSSNCITEFLDCVDPGDVVLIKLKTIDLSCNLIGPSLKNLCLLPRIQKLILPYNRIRNLEGLQALWPSQKILSVTNAVKVENGGRSPGLLHDDGMGSGGSPGMEGGGSYGGMKCGQSPDQDTTQKGPFNELSPDRKDLSGFSPASGNSHIQHTGLIYIDIRNNLLEGLDQILFLSGLMQLENIAINGNPLCTYSSKESQGISKITAASSNPKNNTGDVVMQGDSTEYANPQNPPRTTPREEAIPLYRLCLLQLNASLTVVDGLRVTERERQVAIKTPLILLNPQLLVNNKVVGNPHVDPGPTNPPGNTRNYVETPESLTQLEHELRIEALEKANGRGSNPSIQYGNPRSRANKTNAGGKKTSPREGPGASPKGIRAGSGGKGTSPRSRKSPRSPKKKETENYIEVLSEEGPVSNNIDPKDIDMHKLATDLRKIDSEFRKREAAFKKREAEREAEFSLHITNLNKKYEDRVEKYEEKVTSLQRECRNNEQKLGQSKLMLEDMAAENQSLRGALKRAAEVLDGKSDGKVNLEGKTATGPSATGAAATGSSAFSLPSSVFLLAADEELLKLPKQQLVQSIRNSEKNSQVLKQKLEACETCAELNTNQIEKLEKTLGETIRRRILGESRDRSPATARSPSSTNPESRLATVLESNPRLNNLTNSIVQICQSSLTERLEHTATEAEKMFRMNLLARTEEIQKEEKRKMEREFENLKQNLENEMTSKSTQMEKERHLETEKQVKQKCQSLEAELKRKHDEHITDLKRKLEMQSESQLKMVKGEFELQLNQEKENIKRREEERARRLEEQRRQNELRLESERDQIETDLRHMLAMVKQNAEKKNEEFLQEKDIYLKKLRTLEAEKEEIRTETTKSMLTLKAQFVEIERRCEKLNLERGTMQEEHSQEKERYEKEKKLNLEKLERQQVVMEQEREHFVGNIQTLEKAMNEKIRSMEELMMFEKARFKSKIDEMEKLFNSESSAHNQKTRLLEEEYDKKLEAERKKLEREKLEGLDSLQLKLKKEAEELSERYEQKLRLEAKLKSTQLTDMQEHVTALKEQVTNLKTTITSLKDDNIDKERAVQEITQKSKRRERDWQSRVDEEINKTEEARDRLEKEKTKSSDLEFLLKQAEIDLQSRLEELKRDEQESRSILVEELNGKWQSELESKIQSLESEYEQRMREQEGKMEGKLRKKDEQFKARQEELVKEMNNRLFSEREHAEREIKNRDKEMRILVAELEKTKATVKEKVKAKVKEVLDGLD